MTFQPPPPPPPPGGPTPPPGGQQPYGSQQPYGAPPPYGAQPPGQQWGPPPPAQGPYRAPGAGFDPKTVNPLDWGILAAGFLAFIFSFVSYYSYSAKGCSGCVSVSLNAWHGFFGWFAMLLALIGSAAVAISLFAPQVKLPVPARLAGLGAYALATLCVILAIFVVPGYFGALDAGINKGHGFGFWISLIVIIAGLVLSLMRFQQTGGQLPGALSNMPNIGGHRAVGSPPPPPPGYGPPPGGPGYGAPPPGGPGYNPPPPPPPAP